MTEKKHRQPRFAIVSGIIGITALVFTIVTDVIASLVVRQYSPISETISDLAAGQTSWILDLGLQIGGVGIVVCAIGLLFWQLDGWRWNVACTLLLLIGIDVIIIAQRDVYGDNEAWGTPIHIYLVLFLGLSVLIAAWLIARGLGFVDKRWEYGSRGMAIIWVVFGPLFFVVPDEWDGLYERVLALLLFVWLGSVLFLLIQKQRNQQEAANATD